MGLCCDERLRSLVLEHPGSSDGTSERDQIVYFLEVINEVPPKDRLMVRDPISQLAQLLQLGVDQTTQLPDGFGLVKVRHHDPKMRHPQTGIEATCEHRLPEDEFQLWDHLAGCRLACPCCNQVLAQVVALGGIRQVLMISKTGAIDACPHHCEPNRLPLPIDG